MSARAASLPLLALLLAGCGGGHPAGKRIVEREETVAGAHVRLRSELSPARGTLGDPILWKLTAAVPSGVHPVGVRVAPTSVSLEIDTTRAGAKRVAGVVQGDRSRSLALLLRGFGLGAIPLPRATLLVTAGGRPDTLEFPSDTLFVDSLTAQSTGQLRPDRGPIETPLRAIDIAVMIAGGVILLAILIAVARALLRKRRKEVATPVAPPEPPESILGRELDHLERELSSLPRDLFYERLAQSLRRYASAVTGVDALDLTTSELDRALAKRSSASTRERLIGTLRRADLAKFGRFEDQESEARSILRDARTVGGAL